MNRVHRLKPLHLLTAVSLLVTLLLVAPPPLAEADTGELTWSAQDASGAAVTGTFDVTGPDGETRTVVDNDEEDADPRAGVVTLTDQPRGDYAIAPQAANGQVVSPEVLELSLTETGQASDGESLFVYVDEETQPQAPESTQRPDVEDTPAPAEETETPTPAKTSESALPSPTAEATPTAGAQEAVATAQAIEEDSGITPMAVGPDGPGGADATEPYAPRCEAGYVYGLSANGYIRQVTPSGQVSDLGQRANGVSSFNGIGIGTGGSPVFAYERSSGWNETSVSRAAIWRYDTSTGNWSSVGHSINSNTSSRTVQFVAGAVNLETGKYFLGGFNTAGNAFRIWEYDPDTNTSVYKGHIDTARGGERNNNNGDLAFDANGNLFVVRGVGTTTTVFSVTAANLAAASGGLITSSQATSVTTMSDVNGVAFDASGKAFLGSSSQLRSYDMPGWTGSSTVVASGLNSTDLATCSSPPTITIEKFVEGGRVNDTDQFKLTLHQGNTLIDDTTTTGTAVGLQEDRIGPLPTVRNVPLKFAEVAAGTTSLNNYVSSYRCSLDGQQFAQGNATSGEITIPSSGQSVVCRFHNSPLVADVTIHKDVVDVNGENPTPRPGWTVGMTASATNGSVTVTPPAASTQLTDGSGDATWQLRFGAFNHRATINVSEGMDDGYAFKDGECVVTRLDGTSSVIPLEGPEASALTGVAPGDDVSCVYTNKPISATVKVDKMWVVNGEEHERNHHPEGLTAVLELDPAGSGDADPAWGEERGGYTIGQTVAIDETTAIDPEEWTGCELDSATISGDGIDGTQALTTDGYAVDLPGASNQYLITNTVTCQELTLVKEVTNSFGGDAVATDWNGDLHAKQGVSPELNFDTGETKFVAPGEYVLSETQQPGYAADGISCVPASSFNAETNTVTVAKGVSVECTFQNKDLPGAASWTKVDFADPTVLLPGSEWTITGPTFDSTNNLIVDCTADPCTGLDKDPVGGRFQLEELHWGSYTVTETKAPPGYVLSSSPNSFEFEITAENVGTPYVHSTAFVNLRPSGPDLPMTGGLGRDHILLAGAALLLLALAGYGVNRHRGRGDRSAA